MATTAVRCCFHDAEEWSFSWIRTALSDSTGGQLCHTWEKTLWQDVKWNWTRSLQRSLRDLSPISPRHWGVYSPGPVLCMKNIAFVFILCLGTDLALQLPQCEVMLKEGKERHVNPNSMNMFVSQWIRKSGLSHPLCGKSSIADITTVRLVVMNETGGATLHNTRAACLPQTYASWRAYSQSPRQFGWLIALLSTAARGNREVRRDNNNNNKNGREGRKEGRRRSHKVRAMSSLLFSAVRSAGLYSCQWTSRVTGGLAGTDVLTQHALGWLLRHLKPKGWLPLFLDQIKKS